MKTRSRAAIQCTSTYMSHRSSKTAINLASRAHRRQALDVRRPPPSTACNAPKHSRRRSDR
ncbi:BQ5605_C010g06034 [Microbotryum silenes-dioicae]|uniref:BQ5605_C010g06026 protein n=1 Tax=Microbotryum silenes-dioicae TaxID=796604 RepID=A0A2X0MJK5_9BASI|nr:BQ5605_C010g06026 [Microbotryum silenes-dioicae]SGY14033.1 BQ5605_C010g06034 [Microbotryum silenes-dioicae]